MRLSSQCQYNERHQRETQSHSFKILTAWAKQWAPFQGVTARYFLKIFSADFLSSLKRRPLYCPASQARQVLLWVSFWGGGRCIETEMKIAKWRGVTSFRKTNICFYSLFRGLRFPWRAGLSRLGIEAPARTWSRAVGQDPKKNQLVQ